MGTYCNSGDECLEYIEKSECHVEGSNEGVTGDKDCQTDEYDKGNNAGFYLDSDKPEKNSK